MKLDKRKQSLIMTGVFSIFFGALMTFWGLGKYSEDKLLTFLMYTSAFAIIHRIMASRWK